MNVSRGDVILVRLPFISGQGDKIRPAVVVQSDRINCRLDSVILAPITTNLRNSSEPTQVYIDLTNLEGIQTGVLRPSAIKCENLITVSRSEILRRIGVLSPSLTQQLDAALRTALDT